MLSRKGSATVKVGRRQGVCRGRNVCVLPTLICWSFCDGINRTGAQSEPSRIIDLLTSHLTEHLLLRNRNAHGRQGTPTSVSGTLLFEPASYVTVTVASSQQSFGLLLWCSKQIHLLGFFIFVLAFVGNHRFMQTLEWVSPGSKIFLVAVFLVTALTKGRVLYNQGFSSSCKSYTTVDGILNFKLLKRDHAFHDTLFYYTIFL